MQRIAAISTAGLGLSAILGLFLGISIHTFDEAEGTSYLSNDPRACVNCHIMRDQYQGWQHASHHSVATCNDCHVPHEFVGKYLVKAEHGWRHSKAFTLQDFHEPIRITDGSLKVVQDNCLRCHGEFVSDISHGATYAANEIVDCVRCHRGVGHSR